MRTLLALDGSVLKNIVESSAWVFDIAAVDPLAKPVTVGSSPTPVPPLPLAAQLVVQVNGVTVEPAPTGGVFVDCCAHPAANAMAVIAIAIADMILNTVFISSTLLNPSTPINAMNVPTRARLRFQSKR